MTKQEVMEYLESKGSAQTRKIYYRHGARDPFFGVKVADLKLILKQTGKDQKLAEQLWESGNSDAMYLAALMADEKSISKERLRSWVKGAYWYMLSEFSVAAIAAESPYGWELGLEWIKESDEMIASAGWATLSCCISLFPNDSLDSAAIEKFLENIEQHIHQQKNRVRYAMNNFVINVGVHMPALSPRAQQVAATIGKVEVNMGNTSCAVPLAGDYIKKCIEKGRLGKKRKYARC